MPKLTAYLLVLGLFYAHARAQSINTRPSQNLPDYKTSMANAMRELPILYATKQFDSLTILISHIKNNASELIKARDLELLLAIEQNQFSANKFFDSSTIGRLQQKANESRFKTRYFAYGYDSVETNFNQLTQRWAMDLLAKNELSDEGRLVCEVWANKKENPEKQVRTDSIRYRNLYSLLNKNIISELTATRFVAGISAGIWVPAGKLSLLGTHPTLGLHGGLRNRYNEATIHLQGRFIASPNSYTVKCKDSVYSSNYFSGVYVGVHYTRYLWQNHFTSLGISGGAGYDAINFFDRDDKNPKQPDYKARHKNTLNINAGFQFNYYYKRLNYVGVGARYNMVNYKNAGGTDFRGDVFSLSLIWGFENGGRRWWN